MVVTVGDIVARVTVRRHDVRAEVLDGAIDAADRRHTAADDLLVRQGMIGDHDAGDVDRRAGAPELPTLVDMDLPKALTALDLDVDVRAVDGDSDKVDPEHVFFLGGASNRDEPRRAMGGVGNVPFEQVQDTLLVASAVGGLGGAEFLLVDCSPRGGLLLAVVFGHGDLHARVAGVVRLVAEDYAFYQECQGVICEDSLILAKKFSQS